MNKTANSYIVSKAGDYKFKATHKGNSTSSTVGSIKSAVVLWESFGTSTAPAVGDLVKNVAYSDGYITFTATAAEGNAVIAAKDASDKILWSWHIWLTDQPVGQVYKNSAGTMMDRNLGATSATPGDVGALGLLYQWGRKYPFLWDWFISTGTNYYNDRWPDSDSPKSMNDPCPAGWRVPDGGENGIWAKAHGSSATYTHANDSNKKGQALLKIIWCTTCTQAAPMSILRHMPFARLDRQSGAASYYIQYPDGMVQFHRDVFSKARNLAYLRF